MQVIAVILLLIFCAEKQGLYFKIIDHIHVYFSKLHDFYL